jgi:imidazolonepropionase-like amidohydrolase
MIRMFIRTLIAALIVPAALAASAAADTLRYVIMANGEKVGHVTADVQKTKVKIDYAVSNNGRGPTTKEDITLNAAGVPVDWTINATTLFGAPVTETFSWSGGKAVWVSQADKGEIAAPTAVLYVGNDASPWTASLYVKALLKAPKNTLPVAPSGTMRLAEVRKITLGKGKQATPLTVYELSGIDLGPSYVLMDGKGEFFGSLGGGLIREGYESLIPELEPIAQSISLQRAREAQKKLAHRFDTPVRIRNVRIFDPKTMTLSQPSEVGVYRDRIAYVMPEDGAPTPAGETSIDGQGGTLMPGLHDMHSHTSLSSNLFNLAVGVTATRDMGNDNDTLLAWLKEMEAGTLAGPRIVRNGFLEGRSPYSARLGKVVDTLDQALEGVRWYAAHGYWQIKIYNSMNPDWVAAIAKEAKRYGMGVTGHVPAFSSPDRVIAEGYNDIAHINQLMLGWILDPGEDTRTPLRLTGMARAKDLDLNSARVQKTVTAMKANHVALDTTAMTLERLMLSRAGQVQEGDQPYLDHVPIGYQRYRKRSFVTISSPADDDAYQKSFVTILQTLKMLDNNGIQLLPGTDDTTGFALLRELEVYVKAGIPAPRTLMLATLGCERYFGREADLGTIERGKLADMILVAGDPTKDISQIRQTRMTMVGGVAYYPAEIFEHLAIKPFAAPPPVTVMRSPVAK